MLITLTGTPGTGKTSIAEALEDKGFKSVNIQDFAREHNLGEQRDELEIETDKLINKLKREIDSDQKTVIEGHLSHNMISDYCVVLRCDPRELEDRLGERDYSREKIDENLEAEKLDLILSEATVKQENIIEIDTTGKKPEKVADKIIEFIDEEKMSYGNVDWTDQI